MPCCEVEPERESRMWRGSDVVPVGWTLWPNMAFSVTSICCAAVQNYTRSITFSTKINASTFFPPTRKLFRQSESWTNLVTFQFELSAGNSETVTFNRTWLVIPDEKTRWSVESEGFAFFDATLLSISIRTRLQILKVKHQTSRSGIYDPQWKTFCSWMF